MSNLKMEFRQLDVNLSSEDEGLKVEGIVNKPGELSEILYSRGKRFREVVSKGAFQKAIDKAEKIDYLAEHDNKRILASTSNGSLTIKETDEGVEMSANIVDTSYGRDAYALIKSGIIGHMSFGFRAIKSKWSSCEDGIPLRTVEELEIFEVSSLRNPAYTDSSISARGIEEEDIEVPTETRENKNQYLELRDGEQEGSIELRSNDNEANLFIHGYIGNSSWEKWWDEDATVPQEITDMFDDLESKEVINISINSGGGSVFGGVTIYNLLKKMPGKKIVNVDGLAGSISSIIMMAGDEIHVNGAVMLHKPLYGNISGNAKQLRKYANELDVFEDMLVDIYLTKAKEGIDAKAIKKLLDKDTWMTGAEASKYFNLVDVQAHVEDTEARGNEKSVGEMLDEHMDKMAKVAEDIEKRTEEHEEEDIEEVVEDAKENVEDEESEVKEGEVEEPQNNTMSPEEIKKELEELLAKINSSKYEIEEE